MGNFGAGLLSGLTSSLGKHIEDKHAQEEKDKAAKRELYQKIVFDPNSTQAGREEAAQQLQKLLNPEAKKGFAKILPIFGKLAPPQGGQQPQQQGAAPSGQPQQQPGSPGPLQAPPPIQGAQPQQGQPAQPPPLQQQPNGRPTLRQPLQAPPPIPAGIRTPPFTPPGNQQQPQGQPAAAQPPQQGGIAGMLKGYGDEAKQRKLQEFDAQEEIRAKYKGIEDKAKESERIAQEAAKEKQSLDAFNAFVATLPPDKQKEVLYEHNLKKFLGTTELATDKNTDKDAKVTNIHVQGPDGNWKPAQEHPGGKITELDGSQIDPRSIQDVNRTGAAPPKHSGELGERIDANKIIADPKSTPEEKSAAQATLKNLDQKAKGVEVRVNNVGAKASEDKDEAQTIADGIMSGKDTPDLTGLGRTGMGGRVRAIMDKKGFDYQKAKLDYDATKRYVNSLNSTQQIRLRQAVEFTAESVDKVEDLYDQWQKTGLPGGFKSFNHAALVAASHLPGQKGAIAQTLLTQINDLTSEMGTVYKGGNSSTDESLKLASSNLSADWNDATFKSALGQLRKNLQIRKNSLNTANIGPVKVGEPSPNGKLEAPPKGGASSTIDDLVKKYGGK